MLLLAAVCVGGVYVEGAALLGTQVLGPQDLNSPPIGRYVDVSCDSLERAGTFDNGQRGYLCRIGDRLLPIVGSRSDETSSSKLTGRLREFRDQDHYGRSDTGDVDDVDFIWSDDVLANPAVTHAYIEVTTRWRGRMLSVMALLAGVATIVLSVRWGMGARARWWRRWLSRPTVPPL